MLSLFFNIEIWYIIDGDFMKYGEFQFKKKYGQNFLVNDNIPKKIVDYSNILDDSLVIEIGPGAGALTKILATRAKWVLAYEIDTSLDDVLSDNLIGFDNVDVIYDDFLKRDVVQDIKKYNYKHLYVIANLPYYITTPIITKFIYDEIDVERIVIMVQKEVGERFSAKPKTKNYGSITVFLNYYFDIQKLFDVSRNCFMPKPNVDSVIIALNKKKEKMVLNNKKLFFDIVKDSFQFKRKTLRNNLKKYDLDKIQEILIKHNYSLGSRAEEFPLEVFVDISNNL